MIVTRNLQKVYSGGGCAVEALRGVSLEVADGDFVAIVGPSGSGKSTLMNVLGCLDAASGGYYALDGEDVTRLGSDGLARVRSRKIGFVFQNFNLLPRLTALENAALPLMYLGVPLRERRERAEQALRNVGLYHRRNHLPAEMSGGQQQRVAIARALITQPPLLLADEPTGNLDSASGGEILRFVESLHEGGTTIVLITHDEGVARRCRRRVEMRDGRIREL
ncbi:MAG TPA: ABC transporter ATP-binding protein [Candidatus Spyradocola merdavium]|nr:ABC transporter ATP-binding protein [Candidatus Spyradocola merdavium]